MVPATMDNFFRRVTVSESTYDAIRNGREALRHRLDHLIRVAAQFYVDGRVPPSARIRSLDEGLYKIRVDHARRIPFYFAHEAGDLVLHFGDIGSHEAGVAWHRVIPDWDLGQSVTVDREPVEIEYTADLAGAHAGWISRIWDPRWEERARRNPDAQLELEPDSFQQRLAGLPGPLLLRGGAGSGKTTVAIYRLLMGRAGATQRQLYVTYTDTLREFAARQYDALAEPGLEKPLFRSIPDLCRQLVGPEHKTLFPAGKRMTAARFRERFFNRNNRVAGRDPELFWEEIQAIIKGDPRLLQEQRSHLSRSEYLDCRHSIAADPEAVYQVFEAYARSGDWDDLDLSRAAYWRIRQTGCPVERFDEVVVDEAQDLTGFQIGLILALCKSQAGLFLAGDTQQAIHPSRFDWTRSREVMFLLWNLRLPADRILTLETNYRNQRAVVDVANAIARWRRAAWQEEAIEGDPRKAGPPIRLLTATELPPIPAIDHITTRLMVIAADETAKLELQSRFGPGLVFTVHEAKGLEREFVIVWRPFAADRTRWDVADYQNARFVGIVNRLNVALTRASSALFIVDEYLPIHWPPVAGMVSAAETGMPARMALQAVFDVAPDTEPYILQQARELERTDHHEQAAALFTRIRRWRDAARCHLALDQPHEAALCLGWAGAAMEAATLLAGRQSWREASVYFAQAGNHRRTAECLMAINAFGEALPHWLAAGLSAPAALCLEHLQDWEGAAILYAQLDKPRDSARCFEASESWAGAEAAYTLAGDPLAAATCLERDGQAVEAARRYEALSDIRRAARCLETAGYGDEALAVYRRAENWDEAGHLLARLGRFKEAAQNYVRADDPYLEAAAIYRSGALSQAGSLLERLATEAFVQGAAVDPARSGAALLQTFAELETRPATDGARTWGSTAWLGAECCYQAAMEPKAAERCQQLHDWARQGDWLALADHFNEAERFATAAAFLERGESWARAADCWEAACRFDHAAAAYTRAGDLIGAARCAPLGSLWQTNPIGVARIYRDGNDWARAARAFMTVSAWQDAAIAWYRLGLAGLADHLAKIEDGKLFSLKLGDASSDQWPAHWDQSVACFRQSKDSMSVRRVDHLAQRARQISKTPDWRKLGKDAGI
ncbi:MAG: UvrD-helicase domain-containing protein [Candidatus Sericytochromatia bacterium]|nr:UvrD-helicase domain-containing protein [Candidatus Sericytochromatia bacterium]